MLNSVVGLFWQVRKEKLLEMYREFALELHTGDKRLLSFWLESVAACNPAGVLCFGGFGCCVSNERLVDMPSGR